ncbi:UbiA family prenyltransferase [Fodinibius salinus]|uniref:UbiA family prenyltransferase n=1 Tax=Fodinibius salinus TaxID=860790 RepID=UPI001478772E|nr:UbiA family prenyltransferase [Fodinibius salinus]
MSGGFLLGGFLSSSFTSTSFIIQFFNVHLLLFGGATAYNSYWDKDEGAIGGLRNPPPMQGWMHPASVLLQFLSLTIACSLGIAYTAIFLASIFLFWGYSSPMVRWKGSPIISLIAIGISTGFNAVLLGYVAAGSHILSPIILVAALGVALILLSLYPISQIYQHKEDQARGDRTFAITFGSSAVQTFFRIAYSLGLTMLSGVLIWEHVRLGVLFAGIGVIVGVITNKKVQLVEDGEKGYQKVMQIKYGLSLAFVFFLIIAILLKHGQINGIPIIQNWLLR